MNKTRFEDPVHDPVAVHDPDRCVRDCLSVTCASVGGLWDTASGTYFPAARAGYWEVSAENNSAENKLSANRVGVVGRGRDGDRVATVGLRRRAKACHDAWQQVAPLVGQGENLDVGDLDPGKLVSVE